MPVSEVPPRQLSGSISGAANSSQQASPTTTISRGRSLSDGTTVSNADAFLQAFIYAEMPRSERCRRSCYALAATMGRAVLVGTLSMCHQFVAQGVGAVARAGAQAGLYSLALSSRAGFAGSVGIAAATTVAGVAVAVPTSVKLASGTIAALRGKTAPLDERVLIDVEALANAALIALSLTPALICAYGREEETSNLAATLLILQAGRTLQNIARDTFTQSTRRALPTLRYTVREGLQRAGERVKFGTRAFQQVMVTPQAIGARLLGTMSTYALIIYFLNTEVKPRLAEDWGVPEPSLDKVSEPMDFLLADLFVGFVSSLIEGLDGFTTTLSVAFATWAGGGTATIDPPEGFSKMTLDGLLQDVREQSFVRITNAVMTVEAERGFSKVRGLDSGALEATLLATLALTLTHVRGFVVEMGRHYRDYRAPLAAPAGSPEAVFSPARFDAPEPADLAELGEGDERSVDRSGRALQFVGMDRPGTSPRGASSVTVIEEDESEPPDATRIYPSPQTARAKHRPGVPVGEAGQPGVQPQLGLIDAEPDGSMGARDPAEGLGS